MDDVFAEWDAYARKKKLLSRPVRLPRRVSITAVTGIRRAGKSSILILERQQKRRAAYLNLEDNRIQQAGALDEIIKWFSDEETLFLDEITSMPGWEAWLARTHELLKGRLHIIVSSSRSLLKPVKVLRGRLIPLIIHPLSFNEFLSFKNVRLEPTTASRGKAERLLDEYLVYGGFPEVVLTSNKTEKITLLNSYFKDIVGLDVAELAREEPLTVELFTKYLLQTPYFSASKSLNVLKSQGLRISKETILKLEQRASDAFIFRFTTVTGVAVKDEKQYSRKAYAGDTGFFYAMTGKKDWGRLYENAVFLELLRRKEPQQSISYWRNERHETDFILKEGFKSVAAIQVTYDLDTSEEREVEGLLACLEELKLQEGIIITKERRGTLNKEGHTIRLIPLVDWLRSLRKR